MLIDLDKVKCRLIFLLIDFKLNINWKIMDLLYYSEYWFFVELVREWIFFELYDVWRGEVRNCFVC